MQLQKRDTQTQVKHKILSEYLGAWSGIILNGLAKTANDLQRKGRAFTVRLLYVDGFAFKGRYAGDTSNLLLGGSSTTPTWGSPIIGIQALDDAKRFAAQRRFNAQVMSILVEEDAESFTDLQVNLKLAGLGNRVLVNPPNLGFHDEQIVAFQGDFLARVDGLLQLADTRYVKSFFLLDPYGPKGIPYAVVKRVVSLLSADVMINFPYQYLHRKSGILDRNLSVGLEKKGDRAVLANYDELFGTDQWRHLYRQVWDEASQEERGRRLEEELTRFYLDRLRAADPGIAVKHLRLQFPDRDRTMFYLYLTTHDPTGALTLNEVLWKAKFSEYELRWNFNQALWVAKHQDRGQDTLFDVTAYAVRQPMADSRDVDIKALAMHIHRTFAGQSVTRKDVYTSLVDSDVLASEVSRALTVLKREKRALFDDSSITALIRFV